MYHHIMLLMVMIGRDWPSDDRAMENHTRTKIMYVVHIRQRMIGTYTGISKYDMRERYDTFFLVHIFHCLIISQSPRLATSNKQTKHHASSSLFIDTP